MRARRFPFVLLAVEGLARLTTAGYGASVLRETNATLAGRARNRRLELTR